jgi:tetratricopeptide (TPR) repeat protein
MNRTLYGLIVVAALASATAGAQPNELFQKAGRAYDAGKFAEAVLHYNTMLQQGHRAPQVYFNLGNAEFRQGHSGAAVLAYRRAWQLAPRDADINANLQFALEQTGAASPAPSLPARILQALSAQEWRTAALVLFWLLAGTSCAGLLLPARRKIFLSITLGLFVLFGATLVGVAYWLDLQVREPEVVVMQPAKILFAPLPNATEYYALPAGSLVRLEAREGAWCRIRSAGRPGWLPQSNCVAICQAPAN